MGCNDDSCLGLATPPLLARLRLWKSWCLRLSFVSRRLQPDLSLEILLFALALPASESHAALSLDRGSKLPFGLIVLLRGTGSRAGLGLTQGDSSEGLFESDRRGVEALEAARRRIAVPAEVLGDLVAGTKLGLEHEACPWSFGVAGVGLSDYKIGLLAIWRTNHTENG